MQFIKGDNHIKKVLRKIVDERIDNFVGLRFDMHYAAKRAYNSRDKYNDLKKKREKLLDDINKGRITGGQTNKTKEMVVNMEAELREVEGEMQRIVSIFNEVKRYSETCKQAMDLMVELAECIKNPRELDNLYEEDKIADKKQL
jgi:hypothetical protein